MKYFSVMGVTKAATDNLVDSPSHRVRDGTGKYNGRLEGCYIIEHSGRFAMEKARKALNKLAFNAGEECVLHFSDDVAVLEYVDNSWKVSTSRRSSNVAPAFGDYLALPNGTFIQFRDFK